MQQSPQNNIEFLGKPKSRVFSLVGGGYYIGKVHTCSYLIKCPLFQIDRRSKSANKRGTAFLVQYNGTWANGKWEGAGVLIILKIITE